MISIKTEEELKIMKKSGQITTQAMEKTLQAIKIGRTKKELDKVAKGEIERLGGKSSFMSVPNYHWTTCVTINEEVVHGVPNNDQIRGGDLVSVDLGTLYKGFHTDMARTVAVGKVDSKLENFLKTGKKALEAATLKIRDGARVSDISKVIQTVVESDGYSVVRVLTGHGIGKSLHEDPYVPGYVEEGESPKLVKGMTIAVEVIYTMGECEVVSKGDDGWTLTTADGSLSALFEDTIAVGKSGPIVLTSLAKN